MDWVGCSEGGYTALMDASQFGYKKICKLLIEKGADVNAKTDYGKTALMYASEKGRKEICELFITNGAEVP